ncbi:MAG: RAMP superfamily CRISPR-associated protein [Candidatus Entotheonellia bacterium]
MSAKQWEIHAVYGGLTADDLGRMMGDRKLNPFTRAELLACSLVTPFKETGRAHYRYLMQGENGRRPYEQQIADGLGWLQRLGLERSPFDGFSLLPRWSFGLELRFRLASPYLSRDDDAFYIIDNPVRKEKVFKVPMVSPTGWKGALRAVSTHGLLAAFSSRLPKEPPRDETHREILLKKNLPELWKERARLVLLFGNEKKNESDFLNRWLALRLSVTPEGETVEKRRKRLREEADRLRQSFEAFLKKEHYITDKIEGRQGRLFCFPTFFDKIDLEIINPHDRERRVGKNPILFECVPAGAEGTFRLLYVPYDFPSQVTRDEMGLRSQLTDDLPLLAETVSDLLLANGFGAKTSSGFGTTEPVAAWARLGINVMVGQETEAGREPSSKEAKQPEESATSGRQNKLQREYEKLRAQHLDRDSETTTRRSPPSPPDQERRYLVVDQRPFEIAKLREAVDGLFA